jgi:cell wall-associated NlpC family hydrolase
MKFHAKRLMLGLILCGITPCWVSAQQEIHGSVGPDAIADRDNASRGQAPLTLSPEDGLSVITAALDSRPKRDCSHLVHAIYTRAGFPYRYARSSDLYAGRDEFQRVIHPQLGDLVVWRGHVGIVVNPAQHVFYSAMRSGPGTDTYDAPYWKHRGQVRFYRYIKGERPNSRDRFVLTGQDK